MRLKGELKGRESPSRERVGVLRVRIGALAGVPRATSETLLAVSVGEASSGQIEDEEDALDEDGVGSILGIYDCGEVL